METIYDWASVAIFGGLVVLFLQRSTSETTEKGDSILVYLAAGIGCATANYLGNEGYDLIAVGLLALTVTFIIRFLKPFHSTP